MIAEHKDVERTGSAAAQATRSVQAPPRPAVRNWRISLLVLCLFLALTVAMTWPWALHMGEAINPFGDVVLQMAVLRWDAHALAANPSGLFEAPFFYPYAHSIAFSEHLIGETLVTLPLLLVTGNAALSYNVNLLLSFVLTGFFTYLLARDLTGSKAAGLLAGVAFAFCPFRFMQMGHLHMLATAWFPFTLWALFRWIGVGEQGSGRADDGRRTTDHRRVVDQGPRITEQALEQPQQGSRTFAHGLWFLAALCGFVAMGLSSVYYTFFLLLVIALWFVWAAIVGLTTGEWRAWRVRSRQLMWVTLGMLAVGVILLPVFLPYAQTGADLGVVRTTYELDNWSAQWSYFGKVLQSNWLYGTVLAPNMATSLGERQLFFGVVPSILALVGLVWGRGSPRLYFALLGLFALLMTFGLTAQIPGIGITVPLPYSFFYNFLPGFKALRVPVRFAVLLDFSAYVMAGYGVAAILRRPMTADRRQDPARNSQFSLRSFVFRPSSITAILLALVLLEFANPLDVSNRRDVTAQIATTEPYGWLSRPENAGPIMELPFNPDQGDVQAMLFETRDWQPIVNGWSGFVPPGTVELSRAMAAFPDPVTVSLLQGLEVRHVLVHLWQFPKAGQAALKKKLDGTKELTLVDRDGDNYVYRVAPDPWLRNLGRELGSTKTVWIGEARQGTMPTLEMLAYALNRMGVRWDQMGGNINIGYRPLGPLPFGRFPDYALVPNDPKLSDAALTPVGLDFNSDALRNPAVRVLWTKIASSVRTFDMTAPGHPDPSTLDLGWGDGQNTPANRVMEYYFLAFSPSTATLASDGRQIEVPLPVGVSRYTGAPSYAKTVTLPANITGDARLLRVEIGPGRHGDGQFYTMTNLLPLEVTPSKPSSTLDTRMRAIAPPGNGDFTATIDIYVEPWGTHPDGHFGSWSVVLPGDGMAHDYTFRLDPIAKSVTTVRDGQAIQTFSWTGPPTQGDFRASLVVSDNAGLVTSVPIYLFTLDGSRLTDWQPDSPNLSITAVR